MKYIFMMAGKGTRLNPLTLHQPKSLFKLDDNITIFQRMVDLICKYDENASIYAVTGFMHDAIENTVKNEKVTYVYNPFYAVTNSIASLWFAREYMEGDDLVLINGDIVLTEELVKEVLCKKPTKPVVLLDSSIKTDGDYNVEVSGEKVLVMSKQLNNYFGEYAGVVKLDSASLPAVKKEIEVMVADGCYDQWYENALVQMIFESNFSLGYIDLCNHDWTEVDCVDDLIHARKIFDRDKKMHEGK